MKLTEQSAQALTNLRGHPDFTTFLQWLEENRNKFRDECCMTTPDKVLRPQGKVEVINNIFKAFAEAPATTEQIKLKLQRNTP